MDEHQTSTRRAPDEHQTSTVRKTYTYQLVPTAERDGAMAFVLRRCRQRYNAGLPEKRAGIGSHDRQASGVFISSFASARCSSRDG
jgi:hypothetical protein